MKKHTPVCSCLLRAFEDGEVGVERGTGEQEVRPGGGFKANDFV